MAEQIKKYRSKFKGKEIDRRLELVTDNQSRIERLENSHKEIAYTVPKSEWVCEHNLGKKPSVTVLDADGKTVVMADVRHESDNLLVVTFGMNVTGKLILN